MILLPLLVLEYYYHYTIIILGTAFRFTYVRKIVYCVDDITPNDNTAYSALLLRAVSSLSPQNLSAMNECRMQ